VHVRITAKQLCPPLRTELCPICAIVGGTSIERVDTPDYRRPLANKDRCLAIGTATMGKDGVLPGST
jgi:hypothetical protein